MKKALLLLLTGLILAPLPAAAHDVDVTGVARVFLDQLPDGVYSLSVVDQQVPPLFDVGRILPQRCEALPPARFSYRFSCEPELNAEDTLQFPWSLEGVVVLANWSDGQQNSAYFAGDGSVVEVPLSGLKAGAGSLGGLAITYLILGAEHILFGIDHLLFVLGLLLLQHSAWKLLQTITAFTIAHSITLGFAVLEIFPLPNAPVEVLIALSIVLLAREILCGLKGQTSLVHSKPWLVALIFGLFHGFGFAGALGEIGLSSADVPLALLFFNLGVELGQIGFIAALLVFHALLQRLSRQLIPSIYRGLAYGLGSVAMFWFIERLPSLALA
ncbi:MAG: HupE/UreJ family protein [Pseudomonadales bacterium]|nr:HupE/UreJ family protein [Pseudomonadales bacterium]